MLKFISVVSAAQSLTVTCVWIWRVLCVECLLPLCPLCLVDQWYVKASVHFFFITSELWKVWHLSTRTRGLTDIDQQSYQISADTCRLFRTYCRFNNATFHWSPKGNTHYVYPFMLRLECSTRIQGRLSRTNTCWHLHPDLLVECSLYTS